MILLDQVLQKVQDMEQQLTDQRQDVQVRDEENKHYAEEMASTVMIHVEPQLHDMGQLLIHCLK